MQTGPRVAVRSPVPAAFHLTRHVRSRLFVQGCGADALAHGGWGSAREGLVVRNAVPNVRILRSIRNRVPPPPPRCVSLTCRATPSCSRREAPLCPESRPSHPPHVHPP